MILRKMMALLSNLGIEQSFDLESQGADLVLLYPRRIALADFIFVVYDELLDSNNAHSFAMDNGQRLSQNGQVVQVCNIIEFLAMVGSEGMRSSFYLLEPADSCPPSMMRRLFWFGPKVINRGKIRSALKKAEFDFYIEFV